MAYSRVDLDSITDPLEREATVGIIHNCKVCVKFLKTCIDSVSVGQTPRKLFVAPHPQRIMEGRTELPLGTTHGLAEDYRLLSQGTRLVRGMLSYRIYTYNQLTADFQISTPQLPICQLIL
jgi:hypothetical protein